MPHHFDTRYHTVSYILDTVGDGTGTKNAVGDYSGAVQDFCRVIPDNERMSVYRLVIHIEDTGNFLAGGYGAGAALTNGIHISYTQGPLVVDFDDGVETKTNAGWSRMAYDVTDHTFGSGNNYLAVRLSFDKMGSPIILGAGDRFNVELNDNLTGIVAHYFTIQGLYSLGP